ncbi:MAG: hypothetical protein QXX42_01855 [Thermoplasmatales archaeon]
MEEKKDKIIFLLQKNCVFCEQAKMDFKEPIEKGIIEIVYADEPKGQEILKQIVISKVPACIIFKAVENKYDYCSEEEKKAQLQKQEKKL